MRFVFVLRFDTPGDPDAEAEMARVLRLAAERVEQGEYTYDLDAVHFDWLYHES